MKISSQANNVSASYFCLCNGFFIDHRKRYIFSNKDYKSGDDNNPRNGMEIG